MEGRMKKQGRMRLWIQILFAALVNGYAIGFAKGQIFQGESKAICVPVLNCYSCPGALGACPIGALQAVLGNRGNQAAFYVLGTLMLFGVICGRLICGFLCPFGLVQDLLYKIPLPKRELARVIDRSLRMVKYVMLFGLVIFAPMFIVNEFGIGAPAFCKWICPAGTLGGAMPLLAMNESLRAGLGVLFSWKVAVLVMIVGASVIIARPFCKYLCPLGAFYGFFNRFSAYQMAIDRTSCVDCKQCEQVCPMQVEVTKSINSMECIRCGRCKAVCPHNAIQSGFTMTELFPEKNDEQ